MATLTGQYISQSYQGLINLSTNTGIVAGTMTQLQDGAGTNLGVFFNGLGVISGSAVTSSNDSLINNITVGRGGGNIDTNTTLGRLALFVNTTGADNIAVGRSALRFNTTGQRNVAIGRNTLSTVVTGSNNTAIGYQALNANLASSNTAVGFNAMAANTTGTQNVAIGSSALDSNTTGTDNIAIGSNALEKNVTTIRNTAIGTNALFNLTSGGTNTAVGYNSLFGVTTGVQNTAIGIETGTGIIDGNNNTLIGFRAGYFKYGGQNTMVGYLAGSSVATGSGNLILGDQLTGSSTMNDTILIGTQGNLRAQFNITDDWTFYDNFTVASGSNLTVHGNKQFNYGAFYNSGSISLTQNVSSSITFTTTAEASGVTLSNNSRLNVTNGGVYNLQFSAQLEQGANSAVIYIWFKKNGVNLSDSATRLSLQSNHSDVAAWNYVITLAANDYLEIVVQTDANNTSIDSDTATGNIPAIPSIIATITQVR